MSTSTPLIREILMDARADKVWKAITDPNELRQWCFDMTGFEPKVGCKFTFYGEKDGVSFLHLCEVLEVIPQKKMKWLWTYEGVDGDTYVTFELFLEGSRIRLKLTHEGLEKLPQDENYAKANFEAGWSELIGNLLPSHIVKM